MSKYKTIQKELEKAENIAIFGHVNIDGDAIGSCLGLGNFLKNKGKTIKYFTPKSPDPSFNFVKNIDKFQIEFDYEDYDTLIFLDFSDYIRINKFTNGKEEYFDNKKLIIIDHHIGGLPKRCKYAFKDTKALSTCDIVFELLEQRQNNHNHIDKDIANRLYLGITTDTGNFTFGNNEQNIRTMGNASKLIGYGANKEGIIENIFYKQSLKGLKFIQELINRTKQDGKILYTYYKIKDLEKYEIDAEQAKLFFNSIITKVYGPEIMLLFKIKGREIGGSLRQAKNHKNIKHDCGKIARELFNGGGHIPAAGFPLKPGNTKKIMRNTIKKINNYLN